MIHISRYRKVGYLDIDVGQPEFTPPGFVSLHVLEQQAKGIILRLLPGMFLFLIICNWSKIVLPFYDCRFGSSISAQSEKVRFGAMNIMTSQRHTVWCNL